MKHVYKNVTESEADGAVVAGRFELGDVVVLGHGAQDAHLGHRVVAHERAVRVVAVEAVEGARHVVGDTGDRGQDSGCFTLRDLCVVHARVAIVIFKEIESVYISSVLAGFFRQDVHDQLMLRVGLYFVANDTFSHILK